MIKTFFTLSILLSLSGLISCTTATALTKTSTKKVVHNQFQTIWKQITSDPTKKLPQDKVSFSRLFSNDKNMILKRSQKTLDDHADIIPSFNKLAHPNGICFKGTWEINRKNRYSGYFKKNSKALIIVRASTAMSNTHRGENRSFEFAGKLFPTLDPLKINQENTANFFLIDDLGGTNAEHYTDVSLSNEPAVSKTSEVFKSLLYVIKVASTFAQVDKNPGIRQLYEISHLGESNNTMAVTPQWMKIEAKSGQTVDEADFRDELFIQDGTLIFNISVASQLTKDRKNWENIGIITLDTSVVSSSCDHRLHFHHPKWRSDLIHQ